MASNPTSSFPFQQESHAPNFLPKDLDNLDVQITSISVELPTKRPHFNEFSILLHLAVAQKTPHHLAFSIWQKRRKPSNPLVASCLTRKMMGVNSIFKNILVLPPTKT